MQRKINKYIKWFVGIVALLIFTLYVEGIYFEHTRCLDAAWPRSEALEHANEQINYLQKSKPHLDEFALDDEWVDGTSWVFTYRAKDCLSDICVDNCGTTDICGIGVGCKSAEQKQWSLEHSSRKSLEETRRRIYEQNVNDPDWLEKINEKLKEMDSSEKKGENRKH